MLLASAEDTVDQRYIVPGLVRGLEVLRSFTHERQIQTVAEIARAVGISRSTAFRIVYTLEAAGYLAPVESTKRYKLTSRVLEMGFSFLAGRDLIDLSAPILSQLRDETHASAHLVERDGREVVYLSRFAANTSLVSSINVGSRLPAHATAPGRVLLAALPLSEIVALYEGTQLERYTAATPDSIASLIAMVEADKASRSVVSFGFYDPNLASIAAPVLNGEGEVVAAISITCPIASYPENEFRTAVAAKVEQAALEVSRTIGFNRQV